MIHIWLLPYFNPKKILSGGKAFYVYGAHFYSHTVFI